MSARGAPSCGPVTSRVRIMRASSSFLLLLRRGGGLRCCRASSLVQRDEPRCKDPRVRLERRVDLFALLDLGERLRTKLLACFAGPDEESEQIGRAHV